MQLLGSLLNTELFRCGVFVVNNLHPKPKKKVSIATRKIVHLLEVVHVCGGEPSRMLVWPDYGDNCQKNNYLAAYKVSLVYIYNLFGKKHFQRYLIKRISHR